MQQKGRVTGLCNVSIKQQIIEQSYCCLEKQYQAREILSNKLRLFISSYKSIKGTSNKTTSSYLSSTLVILFR